VSGKTGFTYETQNPKTKRKIDMNTVYEVYQGPGKCVGLYSMLEDSGFILVNINILG
jgi:hypothetical protein